MMGKIFGVTVPSLSGILRKGFAQFVAIRHFATLEISMTKALSLLRELKPKHFPEGLGMSRDKFKSIWDMHKAGVAQEGKGYGLRGDWKPGKGTMSPAPWHQSEKYRFEVDIKYTTWDTGEEKEFRMSLDSPDLLTVDEIAQRAEMKWIYGETDLAQIGQFEEARFSHGYIDEEYT